MTDNQLKAIVRELRIVQIILAVNAPAKSSA
jgi:hypothetical protein